jgi:hypothetical protein
MIKVILTLLLLCVAIAYWPWALGLAVVWFAFQVWKSTGKTKGKPAPIKYKAPKGVYDIDTSVDVPGGYDKFLAKAEPLIQGIAFPSTSPGAFPGRKSPFNAIEARTQLKDYLDSVGYKAPFGKDGSLHDLSSDARLDLIIDTNVQIRCGYRQFIPANDPDIIDAFPCLEFYRLESREEPYNWQSRWISAGGKLFDGRMIARKDDPVWRAISAFGNPYPPFDYNSGMWTRDIDRSEAEKLGVITRSTVAKPHPANF